MCACVCSVGVYVYACVGTLCVCVSVGGVSGQLWVSSSFTPPSCFLRQDVSGNQELTISVGQLAHEPQQFFCPSPPPHSAFLWVLGTQLMFSCLHRRYFPKWAIILDLSPETFLFVHTCVLALPSAQVFTSTEWLNGRIYCRVHAWIRAPRCVLSSSLKTHYAMTFTWYSKFVVRGEKLNRHLIPAWWLSPNFRQLSNPVEHGHQGQWAL